MSRKKRRHNFKGPWITDSLGVDRGDHLTLQLGPPGETGETTAEFENIPVAVAGGIPGEEVEVEITRRYPDSLAATVVSVSNPDSARIEPECPYYLECSGCQWQHLRYESQLKLKEDRIRDAMTQYPETADATVLPAIASPQAFGYRNHARFTVRKDGEIGFVNRHTRQWLRIDRCILMAEPINEALEVMQGHIRGVSQMSVRAGVNTGDLLIQPKLPNPALPLESGGKYYTERLLDRTFRVAGSSFFQVNSPQAEALATLLIERLGLSGTETIVDAYAGVGTFAALLAPSAGRVIAIEESASAVSDAAMNTVGLDNVEFIEAKTEEALPEIGDDVDILILDPPRRGCHPDAIAAAIKLAPQKIVMVSCDPHTMARDLASLCSNSSFILEELQPVDMFPQTHHVECIALLTRSG
ncbi:MAG: class I SAM-dependent RNA methyltransferase [Chloroflexi bacterium]|nr:class I SAM-dependent RNA methyltransferase [Chloroflexota bacterium]